MATLNDILGGFNRTMIAGTAGAPVDVGNTLLNLLKAGYGYAGSKAGLLRPDQLPEINDAPIGGSEWFAQKMRDKGLLYDNPGSKGDLVGLLAGSVVPMVAQAKAPQIAAGLTRIAENAAVPRQLNPQTGAVVWHGSPHKFDKFDASKIGSGEGAQAYGYGLYLAEHPDVARGYSRMALSNLDNFDITPEGIAASYKDRFDGKSIEILKDDLSSSFNQKYWGKQLIEASQGALSILQDKARSAALPSRSHLYKVDLPDEQIAKMLDWDKPLSQQPPLVQQHFEPMVTSIRAKMAKPALDFDNWHWGSATPQKYDPTGQELLALLRKGDEPMTAQSLLNNEFGPAAASSSLQKKGIPGIRYLDGISRADGQGTSNFVVFPGNESLLQILQRNGQSVNPSANK